MNDKPTGAPMLTNSLSKPLLHATVTAHRGFLVMELLAAKSIENQVATSLDNPSNIGQVIINTKEHLGVSAEALALLTTIKRGNDSLGDIDWFHSVHGDCFSWLGGPAMFRDPSECEGSRSFTVSKNFVSIANEPAEGAKQAIDDFLEEVGA